MTISWTEKITNEEVLDKVGMKWQLVNTIRRRQLSGFIGHKFRREEGLERKIIEAEIAEKKIKDVRLDDEEIEC